MARRALLGQTVSHPVEEGGEAVHPCRQVVEVVIPPFRQGAEGVGPHDPSERGPGVVRVLASVVVVVERPSELGLKLVEGRVLEPERVRTLVLSPA